MSVTEEKTTYLNIDDVLKVHREMKRRNLDEHVQRAKLTKKDFKKIQTLHKKRRWIVGIMKRSSKASTLRYWYERWTQNEFDLQEAWKFDKNENFHASWNLPKCTCPKMDNDENYGTKYRIITQGCPVHGFEFPEDSFPPF